MTAPPDSFLLDTLLGMKLHLCSHYGDIELSALPGDNSKCLLRYWALTITEEAALDLFLARYGMKREVKAYGEGAVVVPASLVEASSIIGPIVHQVKTLTAIRYTSGEVDVVQGGFAAWWKGLWKAKAPKSLAAPQPADRELPRGEPQPPASQATEAPAWKSEPEAGGPEPAPTKLDLARRGEEPKPKPKQEMVPATPAPVERKPERAAEVTRPARGCPMPEPTALKEARAAFVLREFLKPRQRADFDWKKAFVAVGGDTGHLYRVTTRWSPDVGRWGVLYDLDQRYSICASNLTVPPSEEALSLMLSVEHFENAFLDGWEPGSIHRRMARG